MLAKIFPARFDNEYRGIRAGLWLFALVTLQRFAISFTHMFSADGGAQVASRMPLDTYPAGAAQNIIALMSRMGLEQFLLACLMLLALVRYRAMVPLMFLVVVVQYLIVRGVSQLKPLVRVGTSGVGTMALIVAMIALIGLVLSMSGRGYRSEGIGS